MSHIKAYANRLKIKPSFKKISYPDEIRQMGETNNQKLKQLSVYLQQIKEESKKEMNERLQEMNDKLEQVKKEKYANEEDEKMKLKKKTKQKNNEVITSDEEKEEESEVEVREKKERKRNRKNILCNVCLENVEAMNVEGMCRACALRTVVCKRPDNKNRKKEWLPKGYKKALKDVKKQRKEVFKSESESDSN